MQISSRTQLNTHTCYRFLAQVLDGCIKQKKGEKSRAKKAKAGVITLLRKNYNENSGTRRGRERLRNYGGKQLADSSPLHTPVVNPWCGEDEEG